MASAWKQYFGESHMLFSVYLNVGYGLVRGQVWVFPALDQPSCLRGLGFSEHQAASPGWQLPKHTYIPINRTFLTYRSFVSQNLKQFRISAPQNNTIPRLLCNERHSPTRGPRLVRQQRDSRPATNEQPQTQSRRTAEKRRRKLQQRNRRQRAQQRSEG